MNNLKKLQLEGNMLKSIPSEILTKGNAPLLDYLKKRAEPSQAPTQAPATVSDISRNLLGNTILNLSNQKLSQIPASAFELGLTKLNLSKNLFLAIPDTLEKFSNLTSVDLSFNKITSLSESLTNCKQLEELNLANNQINNLNGAILKKMSHLKYLIVNNNLLVELPDDLFLAPNLLSVQAGQNRIKQIPSTLENASKLTDLNMANNKVK